MDDNFKFAFGKDDNLNDLTRITFFNKTEIVFTEDELQELFDRLANTLGYETRKQW